MNIVISVSSVISVIRVSSVSVCTNIHRQHADNPEVQTRVCQSLAKLSVSSDNEKVRLVSPYSPII